MSRLLLLQSVLVATLLLGSLHARAQQQRSQAAPTPAQRAALLLDRQLSADRFSETRTGYVAPAATGYALPASQASYDRR